MEKTPDIPVCCVCGRELKRAAFAVNYDNRYAKFIAPDAEPEHGEFGVQYIGSGCALAEKIPWPWLEKV